MKKIFTGKVIKGKVILQDENEYNILVLSLEGKDIDLTLCKHTKKRTNPQNSLYWKCLEIIAYSTGNNKDVLHDYYRSKYLFDIVEIMGEKFKQLKSTTSLSTETFSIYLNDIKHHAFDFLEINLPIE